MSFGLFRVLLFEPDNINEKLNDALYSIPGVDWYKGSVIPVNSLNGFVLTLCRSYLLPEILTNYLFILFNKYQCPLQKETFSFDFQEILLSSGMGQNVILSNFKIIN